MVRLKGAIDPNARSVTLVTTACYSGGWVVNPDLNMTMSTAADSKNTSLSWPVSNSIGRACGSAFVGAMIKAMSSSASPLIRRLDSTETADEDDILQPDDPNTEQTATYNAFCNSIWDVLRATDRMWKYQTISFKAQNDEWEWSWLGRTGIPLADFEKRWEGLPVRKSSIAADSSDPDDENAAVVCKTGGIQDEKKLIDDLTASIAHHRAQEMAALFVQTCPSDWCRGQNVGFFGRLRKFAKGEEVEMDSDEVQKSICFRWETALLADRLLEMFGLPRPDDKMCALWDHEEWGNDIVERLGITAFRALYSEFQDALKGCDLEPADDQGPPFTRFRDYLVASLMEADMDHDTTMATIDKMTRFMSQVKKFNEQRLCEAVTVRSHGREWLRSIGRAVRRSLSPVKRSSLGGGSGTNSPRASWDGSQRLSLSLSRSGSFRRPKSASLSQTKTVPGSSSLHRSGSAAGKKKLGEPPVKMRPHSDSM